MENNVVKNGAPWLLIIQIALWVLYYGNFITTLPWWVVWAPCLLVAGVLVVIAVMLAVAVILGNL